MVRGRRLFLASLAAVKPRTRFRLRVSKSVSMPRGVLAQLTGMCALVAALLFSGGPALFGQTPDLHSVYVAGRLGEDLEGTDPGSGTSVGSGGSFGFFFTERWALDIEAWIPAYITDRVCPPGNASLSCEPGQFRDLLFGVSAVRRFGGNGIHPYVLVGLAKL